MFLLMTISLPLSAMHSLVKKFPATAKSQKILLQSLVQQQRIYSTLKQNQKHLQETQQAQELIDDSKMLVKNGAGWTGLALLNFLSVYGLMDSSGAGAILMCCCCCAAGATAAFIGVHPLVKGTRNYIDGKIRLRKLHQKPEQPDVPSVGC